MSASVKAETRIEQSEGFRAHLYLDPMGKQTIGYGCNVDAGISEHAALCLMIGQVQDVERLLAGYWWYLGLDDDRASVLIELAFWIGFTGLLHFPLMIHAIAKKDWLTASDELMNSKLARQVPGRCSGLAAILRNAPP